MDEFNNTEMQSNEVERIQGEENRINNETERINSEAERVANEIQRMAREDIRQGFYDGFNDKIDEVNSQLAHIEYLDIRQFPKLEGEIDDTERFKRALERTGNGVLKICGTLELSEVITLPGNVKIDGGFKQSTIIKFTNGGFDIDGSYVEIHNCTIDGTNTSEIGIKSLGYRSWLNVNECYIKSFTTWGIYAEGGIAGRLQNLDMIGCGVKNDESTGSIFIRSRTTDSAQPVEWKIRNIYMRSGGGIGLYLKECTDFNVEGVIVEYHNIAFKFEVASPTCYNLYEEANRNENVTVCIDSVPSFIRCTRLKPTYSWSGVAHDGRKALEINGRHLKANNVEVSTLSFNPLDTPVKEENGITISQQTDFSEGHFVIFKDGEFVRLDNAIQKNFSANSVVSVNLGNVNTQSTFILKITNSNETLSSIRHAYREIFVTSALYTDNYKVQEVHNYGTFLQEEPIFSLDDDKNLIVTFKVSTMGTNYVCVKLENLFGKYRRPVFI